MSHDALQQELCDQSMAHQRTIEELRRENAESLHKLQETAEQFERMCEQQRQWMCCVKRFIYSSPHIKMRLFHLQAELNCLNYGLYYCCIFI